MTPTNPAALTVERIEAVNEVLRVKDWPSGEVSCLRCKQPVRLYWNGGELDSRDCCGLRYETEHVQTDLVVSALTARGAGKEAE